VTVEREVLLTGIGGQGVQLAARTLALAAVSDEREVMVFGTYGGSMRGGNTDSTVIVGDQHLLTPPTVDRAWSAVAMHHQFWADTRDRMREGGLVVVDVSVFRGPLEVPQCTVVEIAATAVAADLGNAMAGSMVALGAFAAASGLVSIESLADAAREVLPPYRAQHAARNVEALHAGHASVPDVVVDAWQVVDSGVT
jgi:Pyruvate/2-oxoacid:ferredoxin oxidoreductase gamma subunit